MDEIFTIERHDDRWDGPHRVQYAKTIETAFELAAEEREQHRSTEWDMKWTDDSITFYSGGGASGWVSIRSADLHE